MIAAVALIGMTMLPALARTRPNTRIAQCLNNARQVAVAVQMYTADNHDLYPPNPGDGTITAGYNWCCGSTAQVGDPDIITNTSTCLVAPYINSPAAAGVPMPAPGSDIVAPYVNATAAVFSCPADPRIGTYDGSQFKLIGTLVHVRNISMNGGVGTVDAAFLAGSAHNGVPNLPVPGSWLTGIHGQNQHDNPWATFGKTADFRVVTPSQIFLTTDEDPWSINDAYLSVSAGTPEFIDYPATWHDHGATMSFCDGHVELHRWVGTAITLNGPAFQRTVALGTPDYADWTWLWQHSTVRMK